LFSSFSPAANGDLVGILDSFVRVAEHAEALFQHSTILFARAREETAGFRGMFPLSSLGNQENQGAGLLGMFAHQENQGAGLLGMFARSSLGDQENQGAVAANQATLVGPQGSEQCDSERDRCNPERERCNP
jgi:hypothetical protein